MAITKAKNRGMKYEYKEISKEKLKEIAIVLKFD